MPPDSSEPSDPEDSSLSLPDGDRSNEMRLLFPFVLDGPARCEPLSLDARRCSEGPALARGPPAPILVTAAGLVRRRPAAADVRI